MRAADIVRHIWGDGLPPANPANAANEAVERVPRPPANPANAANSASPLAGLAALATGRERQTHQPLAGLAALAGGQAKQTLPDLLARHGGFPGIDWPGLALTDAQESALWVVQRPDGQLTVLATVDPISKPLSYPQAWPARYTTPEPADDTAPAAPAARAAIARARHCTDCALWRSSASRPVCLKGHPLCWRRIGPGGVHTVPSRGRYRPTLP